LLCRLGFAGALRAAGRVTIGYETPFISLRDACQRIAEAIEAEGWPNNANDSYVADRKAERARRDRDEAHDLFERIKNKANQNPAFGPSVTQAARVFENAERRLERAHKLCQESSKEPPQPGSYEEAMRQLELACRDGAVSATGDLVGKAPEGLVLQRGCEIPAPEISEVSVVRRVIITDRGTFINVKFRIEHIDQIWPRLPRLPGAPAISPAESPGRGSQRKLANAMKRYLTGEKAAEHSPNMDRAVSFVKEEFPGASRGLLRDVYRAEVQQPRGRPRKNRR
jgi:hypothetical protein